MGIGRLKLLLGLVGIRLLVGLQLLLGLVGIWVLVG